MKSVIAWTAAGVVAFVFFLISYLPAAHVISRLDLPPGVSITGVDGTIWEGRAQQARFNGMVVDKLTWSLDALPLLIGNLSADVKGGNFRDSDSIAFEGPLSISMGNFEHVESDGFLLFLPVDRVLAEVKLPLPVNAGGRFRVRIETLDFGPSCNEMSAFGDWLNATVAGTQGPIDMGNFSARLNCAGDNISVTVAEPNLLGLSLNGEISADLKTINVNGQFKPDDSLPQEVHQAARFFGQPEGDGYTRFSL